MCNEVEFLTGNCGSVLVHCCSQTFEILLVTSSNENNTTENFKTVHQEDCIIEI